MSTHDCDIKGKESYTYLHKESYTYLYTKNVATILFDFVSTDKMKTGNMMVTLHQKNHVSNICTKNNKIVIKKQVADK